MLGAGVTQEDLKLAMQVRQRQRDTGSPVQDLDVIVGLSKPRLRWEFATEDSAAQKMIDFAAAALRKRGTYQQAAMLLQMKALEEVDPERQERARELARGVNELSTAPQIEFNWYGGNVTLAHQYQDAVTERLTAAAPSLAKRNEATTVLWTITRYLEWQGFTCTKTAADLVVITGIDEAQMARALALLEQVGAIRRIKRGRTKVIAVTPEGAYRGKVSEHPTTVERFRLEVIEGGKGKTPATNEDDEPALPFGDG